MKKISIIVFALLMGVAHYPETSAQTTGECSFDKVLRIEYTGLSSDEIKKTLFSEGIITEEMPT